MKFKCINKRFLASAVTISFVMNPTLKLNSDYNKYAQNYIAYSEENDFSPKEGNGFNKIKRKKRK